MQLSDTRAIITGGVSGLGLAVAQHFVANGGKVALFDVNDDKGATAVAELGADNARYFREQPVLLGEVLSEDENKDLVEKYFAYQRIAALEEYIVLNQNPAQPEVQIFRRAEGWDEVETHNDPAAQFTLRSVGLTLTLGDLYVA